MQPPPMGDLTMTSSSMLYNLPRICVQSQSHTPPQSSERLASADKTSMIYKAMSRKARLREGEATCKIDHLARKIIRKSRTFGVNLGVVEAKKFA